MGKYAKYEKKYNPEWEKLPKFKGWLQRCNVDADRAYCLLCKKSLRAHKTDLEVHAQRAFHKDKLAKAPGTSGTSGTLEHHNFTVTPVIIPNEVKKSELKLALHVAMHSSIRTVDHLSETLVSISKSHEHNIQSGKKSLFEQIRLHRTKTTRILLKIISPSFHQALRERIKDVPYSIIIDESTDVSTIKYMAVCVRYFNKEIHDVRNEFLGLVEVPITTAEVLFSELKTFLEENCLDIKNMVGIGTDGASNLCGIRNSVYTRLRELSPNLVLCKCICHSLHLCAEKAVDELPSNLEFMLRESYNWFSNSAKRRLEYKRIFNLINVNENIKMINLVQVAPTRWLSRYLSINVIYEQYLELKTHFELVNQRDTTAQMLCQMYKDRGNYLYIVFLRPILKDLYCLNLMFQSEKIDVCRAYTDMKLFLSMILKKVLNPLFHEKASLIENNSEYFSFLTECFQNILAFLPSNCVNLGVQFEEALSEQVLELQEVEVIRMRCTSFLKVLGKECLKRFPPNLEIFFKTQNLSFCKIMNCNGLNGLPLDLNTYDTHILIEQLEKIKLIKWNLEYPNVDFDSTIKFWDTVMSYTNALGQYIFKEISELLYR